MKSPYDSRTEETRKMLSGDMTCYTPNKVYKASFRVYAANGIYFYINQKGYYHIIKPRRVKLDGKFHHYEVVDKLLGKNNMLKEHASYGSFLSESLCIDWIENNMITE